MKVELLESMGDDLSIVNAARVSYAKQSNYLYWCPKCGKEIDNDVDTGGCSTCKTAWEGYNTPRYNLSVKDSGLLRYLLVNRHGTPFEMVQFKFRITCPIGVSREWMRHRIGSFNEVSTRYVEMEPKFYVPEPEAVRSQVGKPGHYTMVTVEDEMVVLATQATMNIAYQKAYEAYKVLLENGIAKELARNVLPLGLMTQFIWSVNLRALLNFLSLRTHETALLEIRILAQEVERLAATVVPEAMEEWREKGRIAP